MSRDGKRLEDLVATIERRLLPPGFKVTLNQKVYDDEGRQIAEFDLEVAGKVGTTDFKWLIECRDRPSQGPAPGSWVEQLVGRRSRFGFNKVTAVSTTGFGMGAIEFARTQGVELREVRSLQLEEFQDWLQVRHITQVTRMTNLRNAVFIPLDGEPQQLVKALETMLPTMDGAGEILRGSTTGELVSAASAFSGAASHAEGFYDDVEPNGPAKEVRLLAKYPPEDHFLIDTPAGAIRLEAILFEGDIRIETVEVPVADVSEYRQTDSGEAIAQIASFAPQSLNGLRFSIELHKQENGETDVLMRRLEE